MKQVFPTTTVFQTVNLRWYVYYRWCLCCLRYPNSHDSYSEWRPTSVFMDVYILYVLGRIFGSSLSTSSTYNLRKDTPTFISLLLWQIVRFTVPPHFLVPRPSLLRFETRYPRSLVLTRRLSPVSDSDLTTSPLMTSSVRLSHSSVVRELMTGYLWVKVGGIGISTDSNETDCHDPLYSVPWCPFRFRDLSPCLTNLGRLRNSKRKSRVTPTNTTWYGGSTSERLHRLRPMKFLRVFWHSTVLSSRSPLAVSPQKWFTHITVSWSFLQSPSICHWDYMTHYSAQ